QRIVEIALFERLQHARAHRRLRDARCRRVDRCKRVGQRLTRADEAVTRMHHLAQANLAKGAHELALLGGLLELRDLAGMEMEETQHQPLGSDDELKLAPEYDAHPLDASFNQRRLAGWRGVRRGKD